MHTNKDNNDRRTEDNSRLQTDTNRDCTTKDERCEYWPDGVAEFGTTIGSKITDTGVIMNFDVERGQTNKPAYMRWDGDIEKMRRYLAPEWWEMRQYIVNKKEDGRLSITQIGDSVFVEPGQYIARSNLRVYDNPPVKEVAQ